MQLGAIGRDKDRDAQSGLRQPDGRREILNGRVVRMSMPTLSNCASISRRIYCPPPRVINPVAESSDQQTELRLAKGCDFRQ